MPNFGHRVIGEAAFQKEAARESAGEHRFGPRVLGTESAPARGSGRREPTPEPVPPGDGPPTSTAPKPEAAGVSIAELGEALAENPLLAEPFYEQELARPGGARVGALTVLQRAFGPDAPEFAEIAELLAEKRGKKGGE